MQFYVENINRIRKFVPKIESSIKIKVSLGKNRTVNLSGKELNQFIAEKVIKAIDLGFDIEDALILKDENYSLELINIKDYSRRKNLKEVRARIIGREGRAKKTIEELTGAILVIKNNVVGAIVSSEHLSTAVQGIISLIQGTKHSNVFAYLEKQNANLRNIDDEDLGLRKK